MTVQMVNFNMVKKKKNTAQKLTASLNKTELQTD